MHHNNNRDNCIKDFLMVMQCWEVCMHEYAYSLRLQAKYTHTQCMYLLPKPCGIQNLSQL